MFRFWKISLVCSLLLSSVAVFAEQVKVDSLRYWTAPDHTRMVFDVSQTPSHQVFLLDNPARLVIDLNNAKLQLPLRQPPASHPLFSRVRSATRNKKDLRVVVDLKTTVTPKSFALKPSHKYGHRLVVDLFARGNNIKAKHASKKKYGH